MQHRMEAGLRKYLSDNTTIINYASYQAKLILNEDETPAYSSSFMECGSQNAILLF